MIAVSLYDKSEIRADDKIYLVICTISLILAMIAICAVVKKKVLYLKVYFYWKSVEIVVIPII